MNEIVKYHNQLNTVSLSGFNCIELNIFYSALYYLKEKDTSEITIPYGDLQMLANMKKNNPQYIYDKLTETKKKIFHLSLDPLGKSIPGKEDYDQHLFSVWYNSRTNRELKLGMDPNFTWLVNDNRFNFTSFELMEFVNLKSVYAKNLFKILKQWKKAGRYRADSIAFLRFLLAVAPGMKDEYLSARIIRPAVKEIREKTNSFRNLGFRGIYDGRNHKLEGFVFEWQPEQVNPMQLESRNTGRELYRLHGQVLTEEEYSELQTRFPTELVDKTIQRILEKPYYGCLCLDTIAKWCQEDIEFQNNRILIQKPKALNYCQRDYDYAALEKMLLEETRKVCGLDEKLVLTEEDQKAGYCLDKDVAATLGLKWIGDKEHIKAE